jgi:uncharacterized repeat protein (TIGR01451 family)
MKKLFTLLVITCIACSRATANDTLVKFGQNLVGAATWSYIGGGTNLDAVPSWKTLAYTEPGWLTAQPAALGFGSNPPVRNTAIPEDNSAGGGGIGTARFPTLYFRKVVNITSLTPYVDFTLRTKFDDGIIVWINGAEAFRSNISTIPTNYATLADIAIGGDGSAISSITLSKTLFTTGNNIIAVEIHQSTLTSSDLFFDAELIANTTASTNTGRPFTARYNNPSEKGNILFVANNFISTQGANTTEAPPGGSSTNNGGNGFYLDIDNTSIPLFPLGSAWSWFSNGTLPSATWTSPTYIETGWTLNANGELGYGDGDETTCIPSGGGGVTCFPTGNKYWTYYFRKSVNIPSLAGIDQFTFRYKRDDGIVVYVNGVEVFRENMPTGAIANNTPASTDISNENAVVSFTLAGIGPFVAGNNVIAVEMHQRSQASSDLSFDMSLEMGTSNSTFSSSSADLNLPSTCSEVLFAGLYWGATLGSGNNTAWRTGEGNVMLKIPGSSSYTNVTATQIDYHDFGVPNPSQDHVGYSAFADVTPLLNVTNANGTYTVANAIGPTGFQNCAGGWALVIAYKDLADPITRNLVVFDGAAFVTSAATLDVPFAGFQTPVVGPVTADFGVIAYDGDRGSADGFFFKQDSAAAGFYLDMALPANATSTSQSSGDSWNSTISYLNTVVTTRNPAHNNTLGFDADIVRLNNPGNSRLNNNRTSARLRLSSSSERYYLQTITSAISVAVPTFRGGITATDLNGGGFAPLDSLRYTINWQNKGSDTATNVFIVDTIPQNVVYKRNSLRINGFAKTDLAGDDEAEWDSVGNRVIFRIGTSANTTNGGQVLPDPLAGNSGTVSFTTTAIDICELLLCNANVVNKSQVFYTGKLSGDNFLDIIGTAGTGCTPAIPVVHTIVGACQFRKDTILQNRCLTTTVTLPTLRYPGYKFYRQTPFTPANEIGSPTVAINATGLYYGYIFTAGGCPDTVSIRVRINNCLDIDDDNDGIPDYVETMIPAALADHDSDGVPNWNDAQYPGRVDYNGDGVDDRFDAGADADNDGNPNYYDTDFTFGGAFVDTNNDGVNDLYDRDFDGLINQYDLDSDQDGIPDVTESYGADDNGDGIIDWYTDTDGDGFSQNVDGSNSGSTASGVGLGAQNLDGDALPNFLDTDSDQDGIPDIAEVFGPDVTNRGKIDGFADMDVDGLTDAYRNATGLLLTGADVNSDGRADSYPNKNLDRTGRPNAYDMDSDGDGITDVIEAGFNDANFDGRVDGAIGTNGWGVDVSNLTALNLRNTDAIGNPDYLDIDADEDGIPDNIEGMPTVGYLLPLVTDADNDGLTLPYDNLPAAFGGAGIFVYDRDGDGTPDYRDLDTDGDGALDICEGNDWNLNGSCDENLVLTGLDTDGDGLDNVFDSLTSVTNLKGTSYMMGNGGSFTGDAAPGARATVQRRLATQGDRDWRWAATVLPVEYLSFNGSLQTDFSVLNWAVIAADAVASFTVERSIDNERFTAAGIVSAASLQINTKGNFTFNDDISNINSDVFYYRLRATGKNGELKYSYVLVLRKPLSKSTLRVVPNPANDVAVVKFYAPKQTEVIMRLVSNIGKIVLQQKQKIAAGNNAIQLNKLSKFATGVYTLQVIINGETLIQKVIISH